MRRRWVIALLGGLLLAGPLLGQGDAPNVKLERGIVFGKSGERELQLDLAMPARGEGPFPAVLCIHGGGWVSGDRQQMSATIAVLAARGYVAVSPDYRLAPADRFPAPLHDCKAVVRWLRANAGTYHINSNRIGAMGYSAGGHLACLLGVTDRSDGLEGDGGNAEQSSRVQAVVSFFGPTDLRRPGFSKEAQVNNLAPLLGGTLQEQPEKYRQASPVVYVHKDPPPILFLHGTRDPVVPVDQSQQLAEQLRRAGGKARVVLFPGEGHGWRGDNLLKSIEQMTTFFDENLKK